MDLLDLASILDIPDLSFHLNQIDVSLDQATNSKNAAIKKPIHRLIHAKGKRLRPALLIACASINGKEIDQKVFQTCAAVELVHIASLVHDDIIDKA